MWCTKHRQKHATKQLPIQPCNSCYTLNLAVAQSTLLLFVVCALWFAGADLCSCSFQTLRHLHALLPCKLLVTEKSAAGYIAVIKQCWPGHRYYSIATSCIADLQQNSHIWWPYAKCCSWCLASWWHVQDLPILHCHLIIRPPVFVDSAAPALLLLLSFLPPPRLRRVTVVHQHPPQFVAYFLILPFDLASVIVLLEGLMWDPALKSSWKSTGCSHGW